MRRSITTIVNFASAAAIEAFLLPLVASAAAPPQTSSPFTESSPIAGPAIDQCDSGTPSTRSEHTCATDSAAAREGAYLYLVTTAHPGGTMMRQGPAVAIGRLHPEFATRLAAAIGEARVLGLTEAGISSAYRPPAFGVGGFGDKFSSLHAYGLAVDMHGIGGPGSSQAKLWHKVGAKHGVACPYGANNRKEWNHCQPTRVKAIRSDNPLRTTISAVGPLNSFGMFEAGTVLIENVANLFQSLGSAATAGSGDRTRTRAAQSASRIRMAAAQEDRAVGPASRLARRNRIADMSSSNKDRPLRVSNAKGHSKKAMKIATTTVKTRGVKRAGKHQSTAMSRRNQRASPS